MATVRDTDLPDLLIALGYQVKRIGRYYTTQEMDSIRIKDRRTWFRYSEGIGGDAITFLQRFYNKSFPEAVEYLLTWHGRVRDSPPASTPRQTKEKEEKVPFTLPPANVDHRRVFAYLRKRGIAPQVIRGFVEAGLLYEDAQHHNCVFVGRTNQERRYLPINEEPMIGTAAASRGMSQAAIRISHFDFTAARSIMQFLSLRHQST